MKPTWPPETFKSNFVCCLPDKPGVKPKVQQCPRCQAVHVTPEEIQRCQQQAAWREQA